MKSLLTFVLVFITATAFAQQQSYTGSTELSLDVAIHMALDSNYAKRIAQNSLEIAQYTDTKAWDNLLPIVSARSAYSYDHALTNSFRTRLDSTGIVNFLANPNTQSLSYGITGSLNLYNGGFDASNIRAAKYNLESAQYNLKWIRQEVAFNVVSAYITALRTKELQNTNEKTLVEYQAQLARLQGLYQAGSIAIGQVLQQQAVVAQQQVQVIQARNNFQNAKADLLYLLNVAPDSYQNYDVSLRGIDTSLTELKRKESTEQPSTQLLNSLMFGREDFLSLQSSIFSSEAAVGLTRAALLPRLSLSTTLQGSGSDPTLHGISLFHDIFAALNLTIPIYDAAQNRLQIDILETQIETSKVQLDQAQQQFRSDVAKAQNNMVAAGEAVAATATEVASAEESLRSAEERLRVGAGIQVDVIVAEAQVQTARTDRINSVYNYLLATRQLEYLLGRTNY